MEGSTEFDSVMVSETVDHAKLFEIMYSYETAIYEIQNFTMP